MNKFIRMDQDAVYTSSYIFSDKIIVKSGLLVTSFKQSLAIKGQYFMIWNVHAFKGDFYDVPWMTA